MTEYSNTVQLTEERGRPRCLSDRNTRGPPPGETAEYVTTWCVHRFAPPQQTDDDRADAPTNSAGEPGGRARRGLSHLRSLSGKPDDSDPLTRRASFLEKVDVVILFDAPRP